jgi:hypothetical protein
VPCASVLHVLSLAVCYVFVFYPFLSAVLLLPDQARKKLGTRLSLEVQVKCWPRGPKFRFLPDRRTRGPVNTSAGVCVARDVLNLRCTGSSRLAEIGSSGIVVLQKTKSPDQLIFGAGFSWIQVLGPQFDPYSI